MKALGLEKLIKRIALGGVLLFVLFALVFAFNSNIKFDI